MIPYCYTRNNWKLRPTDDSESQSESWFIQTELMREQDRDRKQNGSLYITLNLHTATYVGI